MNLESITLGQVAIALAFVVALWKSLDFIKEKHTSSIKKMIEACWTTHDEKIVSMINEQNKKISSIQDSLNDTKSHMVELALISQKNFLTRCFNDLENNVGLSDVIIERIADSYKLYIESGGNGYIKAEFEKLKEQGKI